MDVSPSPSLNGTCALIQEVGQKAAHDSLVGDDEDIALALQLHDDRLQPLHQILVGLWREVGQAGRKLQAGSQAGGRVQGKEATAPSSPAGFPPGGSATSHRLLTPPALDSLKNTQTFQGQRLA